MHAHARDNIYNAPLDDSARGAMIAGAAIMAAFFLGLGGWAAFAPLNSAAVAPAVVKVEGNRKSVQHLEGGIVKELRVREGDKVATEQTLILLDDTQARAAVDVYSKQYDELTAQEARLIAERDGAAAVQFPQALIARRAEPDVAAIIAGQTNLFKSRRTTLTGTVDVLRKKISQTQEQIVGLEGQAAAYKRQLQSTHNENNGLRDLFKKGYVPRQRMLELERSEAALEGQIAEVSSNILRARQSIEEVNVQIVQAQSDRLAQVANDLRDVQVKLLEIGPKVSSAKETLRRTEIRSPYAGVVVGLTAFSVGGVISPGEKIMDVVPEKGGLIVEATVAPEDVKDLHVGMRAEVHLTAYKQRTVPDHPWQGAAGICRSLDGHQNRRRLLFSAGQSRRAGARGIEGRTIGARYARTGDDPHG
jgi:HlyD family type I secretion membrane fusion protein